MWVHSDRLLALSINGVRLVTTEDHPFWNATDGEWERADALDRGDLLHTPDGKTARVDGIIAGTTVTAAAYNLIINDLHTYYVLAGSTPVLVHNTGPCDPLDAWSPGTLGSAEGSATYHVGKHGKGRTLAEYTDEAKNLWARTPEEDRIPWKLKDGSEGWKIKGGFLGGEGISEFIPRMERS